MAYKDDTNGKKSYDDNATDKDTSAKSRRLIEPANFQMIYESHDGKLCLFETREGHLSAVKASRFA